MPQMGPFTIPALVGTLVNWALFGALLVQVYLYTLAFPKDKLSYKMVVGFIFILEILQTVGDTRDAVRVFGSGWGNPQELELVGWAWFTAPILGSTIACVGQIFFAWRISIFGNSWYIPGVIAVVSLFQLAAGIWTGVMICRSHSFLQLQFHTLKTPVAWLAAMALADLIIVAATVFYLMKHRNPDYSHTTRAAVSRILKINASASGTQVTVETGIPCSVFAIVNLYLFVAYSANNYNLGIGIFMTKVYSNSIMVIMNSRAHISHGSPASAAPATEMVFQSYSSPSAALQATVETNGTISTDFGSFMGRDITDKRVSV
ncbi:hypothetical protein DFH08DRAFT_1025360 [Mycena albidolilacea]|uniref:DUF6534 domain-containing protein n=1 Tax=Mycena albidolilacea TaxID=1033008 RepID=A0AAD7F2H6_9AGAR|nr:hypothetical protein DFH08DRAFT_1025360 [Mycena albidolilacea]